MKSKAITDQILHAEWNMRPSSGDTLLKDYRLRIDRVIHYIHQHFCEDLSLTRLAGQACLSKFHFHRVFQSLVGETVTRYVRRVRLEKAANRLAAEPAASIAQIAVECGFSSSQNFARSFKAHYGYSPTAVRMNSSLRRNFALNQSRQMPMDENAPFCVEIQTLPACCVAYIRRVGSTDPDYDVHIFNQLFRWAAGRGLADHAFLRPMAVVRSAAVTPPCESIFDACVTVPERFEGDGDIGTQNLPGGPCGVLRLEIRLEAIPEAIKWLYEKWLPQSGCEPDDRPFFIIFYNNPHGNPRKLAIMEMCLPVRQKSKI